MKKPHLIIIAIASIFWLFWYRNSFFKYTNVQLAGEKYSQSQYVLGDASPEPIKDSTLYEYAASRYIQGEDPTQINFEHPPLGKYVLGLSWLVFGNTIVINVILYVLCLLLFWELSGLVLKKNTSRLISLIILSLLSLFPHYAFDSLLDIQLLFATLLFFSSLFKKNTLLTGLSLGYFISIKYPFPSAILLIVILLIASYKERKLLVSLFLAVLVYIVSYTAYFIQNPNPLNFFRFEWYRFRWWTGERTIPQFLMLDTIFRGRFQGWWGEVEYSQNWNVLYPVGFFTWILGLTQLKNFPSKILGLFSFCMLLLYLFGSASSERYLIQIVPFWVLFSVMFFENKVFIRGK